MEIGLNSHEFLFVPEWYLTDHGPLGKSKFEKEAHQLISVACWFCILDYLIHFIASFVSILPAEEKNSRFAFSHDIIAYWLSKGYRARKR
jgi:hypothetical protein